MIFDPAFVVQKQANFAKILSGPDDRLYTANFRGGIVQVKSAGDNPLSVGDICALVDFGPIKYVIKSDAGYPSRWIRSISEWHDFPAALFLKYVMRNNPKIADFKIGSAVQAVSDHVLRVMCWDGMTRDLSVEYAGNLRQASVFSADDPVLCYWKNRFEWVVIGKDSTISVSPTTGYFGGVPIGQQMTMQFSCIQTNSSVPVRVRAVQFPMIGPNGEPILLLFPISTTSVGGRWSEWLTLSPSGGTWFCRFTPGYVPEHIGALWVFGEAETITIPLSGHGTYS